MAKMPPKSKAGAAKGSNKRSGKRSSSGSSSRGGKPSTAPKSKPTQHKPAPRTAPQKDVKKKPPHMRYSEKELKVPQLNGIRPAGVQKIPNQKKGKKFVDDGEGMKTILAMVMADKEGDVESKMMRARQLEEVREARKAEMEKRAGQNKEAMEERKGKIRDDKKKKKGRDGESRQSNGDGAKLESEKMKRRPKKRVSFG